MPRGRQAEKRGLVIGKMRRLPLDAIGIEPEPREVGADRIDEPLLRPGKVGIVDAQHEPPAAVPREQPRPDRGLDIADVEIASGRWGEAGDDGHAVRNPWVMG